MQVEANTTALTGVREEERVGQRTLLDVLNAEVELLNSQVQLVHDAQELRRLELCRAFDGQRSLTPSASA